MKYDKADQKLLLVTNKKMSNLHFVKFVCKGCKKEITSNMPVSTDLLICVYCREEILGKKVLGLE